MRRAALYLRVSTQKQELLNQLPKMEQLARARDCEIVSVREEVESRDKQRPVIADLLEEAHRGSFQVLVVWAIDRLGAGMLSIINTVRAFDARGVQVLSVTESWLDMQGPVRNLLLGVFGWISEQELAHIRERTVAGLARARAQGKQLGRPTVSLSPYAVELELERLAPGEKLDLVAKRLGVGRATLFRELRRLRALGRVSKTVPRNGAPNRPKSNGGVSSL